MTDSGGRLEKQDSLPFPPTPVGRGCPPDDAGVGVRAGVTPRRVLPDAPNILIVLMDDAGPGQPSTFGGEISTPTLDRVLGEGIGFNRFHTTALCSPTRASLLTGRNHHKVCTGVITEFANDWGRGAGGGYPRTACWGGSAEGLRLRHRCVGQVAQHAGHRGASDQPVRVLADELGVRVLLRVSAGESSQFEPNPVWNTTFVLPSKTPDEGYHLNEDLADDAIGWLRRHKALAPDRPFYMYWASGAIHGPHHVMKDWADKYRGKFDDGWDAYRERVFERAKDKGWIPSDDATDPATRQLWLPGTASPRREAVPAPPDGSVRRLCRACRRPDRPHR